MNTSKIAALYAQVSPAGRLCLPIAQLVLHNRRQPSADGYTYRVDASCMGQRGTYRDALGDRCAGFIDEYAPERVANWIKQQMPGYPEEILNLNKEVTGDDQYLVGVWGYVGDNSNLKTTCMLRYGALSDFTVILRGMAAYQRKCRKQERKTWAQLEAYEQLQIAQAAADEQLKLRKGQWLGTEKALTTAARVDEPGVAFMGDANLTPEQRQTLHTWAVPAGSDMEASFPTGTGIALKQIHRSRELVEGAVYLYQCEWTSDSRAMILGRALLEGRSRGHLQLKSDDRPSAFSMPLEWGWAGLKVFRVTHYTTRNAAALPVMQAETQPAQAASTKSQPKKQRELAYAA